jgi:hypothetical protein
MSASTTAAAVGSAHQIEHEAKTYRFRLIDQNAKGEFQRQLEKNARAAAMALKGEVAEQEWKAAWNATVAQIASKAYRFHGDHASQAPTTFGGMVMLLAILGTVEEEEGKAPRPIREDEMEALAMDRGEEVVALLNLIMEESFPNLKRLAKARAEATPAPEETAAPEAATTP